MGRRSEYRRQYKEPSWGTYQDVYHQLVSYRVYRRQLEHHHNFVEWDWDTESEGGGGGGNIAEGTPPLPAEAGVVRERVRTRTGGGVSEGEALAARGLTEREVQTPRWHGQENEAIERKVPETTPRPKTSPERGVKRGGGAPRPLLLPFGWADSQRDVGAKKTFNVRASAHGDNTQVFPAALRAMRRNEYAIKYREEQRKREALKARRRRSVFNMPPPDDTIWMTEYQRNYSAHASGQR